ncbi:MAG TPA: hypothetical protein VGF82_25500 [Terracidiphilus sp.]|jgi:hypothetical protein
MGIFDLHWLRGPGQSSHENFEILCLDLLCAENPKGQHRRLDAPDSGIDILGHERRQAEETTIAYQCKAYASFSSKLVAAVEGSVARAKRLNSSSNPLNWQHYCLLVPLLLTAGQRASLETVWQHNDLAGEIRDIDWLERLLFKHSSVRSRFFPEFRLLFPPQHTLVDIGFPAPESEKYELHLFSKRLQQRVKLRVPIDITVGGLVSLLVDKLGLPTEARVQFMGIDTYSASWKLHRSDTGTVLDDERTFRELEMQPGIEADLLGEFNARGVERFVGGGPRHKRVAIYDHKHGWVGQRGAENGDRTFISKFMLDTFDRRLGPVFPSWIESDVSEISLSEILDAEQEEDRRLPPVELTVELSEIEYVLLAHALVEFGGYPIKTVNHGQILVTKEQLGEVMTIYDKFHRVLEAQKDSLAQRFNDIDKFWSASWTIKSELLTNGLLIGPGPGTIRFSKKTETIATAVDRES